LPKTAIALPDYSYEMQFWEQNQLVAGIDEAGRGPLAGPVVAAAVVLPIGGIEAMGINDSKKLNEAKRIELFDKITALALTYSIIFEDNIEIDRINILQATQSAMKKAIHSLSVKPDQLLIDGNYFKFNEIPFQTIVKGDTKSISIAAASILAKVARDRWMTDVANSQYPEYGFAKHKGYATKLHYEAIEKNGLTPIHRLTFLKNIISPPLTLF
jgi:ribonuclease HII